MVVRLSFRTTHLVPFWFPRSWYLTRALGALPTLPSVDAGITKPDTGFRSVARQHSLVHLNLIDGVLVTHPDPADSEGATYVEPVSEGEGGEVVDIAPARDEGARIGIANAQAADAIAFCESHLKEREQPGPSRALSIERLPEIPAPPTTPVPRPLSRGRTLSIDLLVPVSAFDDRFEDRLHVVNRARKEDANTEMSPGDNQNGDDRVLTREWHALTGKRIAMGIARLRL
jgi:hypothetical protein